MRQKSGEINFFILHITQIKNRLSPHAQISAFKGIAFDFYG